MTWLRITITKDREEKSTIVEQFRSFIDNYYVDVDETYLLYTWDFGSYARKVIFSVVNTEEKIVFIFHSKTHYLSVEEEKNLCSLRQEKGFEKVRELKNQLCKEITERDYIAPLFAFLEQEKITAKLARIDWM